MPNIPSGPSVATNDPPLGRLGLDYRMPKGPRQINFPFWNFIGLENGRTRSSYEEVILTQALRAFSA